MDYCGPKALPLSEFLSWSQADQDNALWWQGYESRRCECGTHPDEWEDWHAYHAETYTCRGCEQIQAKRASVPEEAQGVHIRLARGPARACDRCHPRKVGP